jgi:hypothetical protein
MPSTTEHETGYETTQNTRRGAGYYFLLIALLVFSGLYFGFAIPTFLGILGMG